MNPTLYATADPEDLDDDGTGRIRILAEFNDPRTEVDMVGYPADEDETRAKSNIHRALSDAGYERTDVTLDAVGGLVVPVRKLDRDDLMRRHLEHMARIRPGYDGLAARWALDRIAELEARR